MNILLRLAQAAGLSFALTVTAFADEPLKIATSAGPVGQLASYAAKLAKEKGQDVKIVELSDWVALNEVVNSGDVDANLFQHGTYLALQKKQRGFNLVQVDKVLKVHRGSFLGRSSPVNFFWGTFDLAYTRYSGRPAEPPPGSGLIYRRSANAEQICAGFWPGDERVTRPAFFSYTYPKPEGLEGAGILPSTASWSDEIGEFLLPYEDVRTAAVPAEDLASFFESTYEAGAALGGWERAALEEKLTLGFTGSKGGRS